MNDREEWRERVRDIRAASTIWWWWWNWIFNHFLRYPFVVYKVLTESKCQPFCTKAISPTPLGGLRKWLNGQLMTWLGSVKSDFKLKPGQQLYTICRGNSKCLEVVGNGIVNRQAWSAALKDVVNSMCRADISHIIWMISISHTQTQAYMHTYAYTHALTQTNVWAYIHFEYTTC